MNISSSEYSIKYCALRSTEQHCTEYCANFRKWFLFSNSTKSNRLWLLGCVQLEPYETFYWELEDGEIAESKKKIKNSTF